MKRSNVLGQLVKPGFTNASRNRMMQTLLLLLVIGLMGNLLYAESIFPPRIELAPEITNVRAVQRTDGSRIVDIYYDLYDANDNLCDITLVVSGDGGVNFDVIPSEINLGGDIGNDLPSGTNKHIMWNAGAESYPMVGTGYIYRISADDGSSAPIPASFIHVLGGTFHNGTSNVTISSFYMDKYEVTQESFLAVMGYDPASSHGDGTAFPVYRTSWFRAVEYCNRRSMMDALTPCYSYGSHGTNPDDWPVNWYAVNANHANVNCNWNANGYRLPTEMEWMFAAKGGNLTQNYTYSGSNTLSTVAWYDDNSGGLSHVVGTKAINELGFYDLSGNISEWCWDIYDNYPSGPQTDPRGAVSGSGRVSRGGSFISFNNECTVVYRDGLLPTSSDYYYGFRICRKM